MRQSETSENIPLPNNYSKERDSLKGKEKIDSWIDDIIKQHKKQLDEIKKNRALDEQEEKFSFRDKNFVKNYTSNDKDNNSSSKVYNDKNNERSKKNEEIINRDYGHRVDDTCEKIKHSTIESNTSNIFSNNLDSNNSKNSKNPNAPGNGNNSKNLIEIKDTYFPSTSEKLKTEKQTNPKYLEEQEEEEEIIDKKRIVGKEEQRRSKSNANIALTFKSLEDEYSHLDKINPIMSPNNNLFLQTDFNSIELNSNEDANFSPQNNYKNTPGQADNKSNADKFSQKDCTEKTENSYLNNKFIFQNDKSPLRTRIANSSNTVIASSKYSNLNSLNQKNNLNAAEHNKNFMSNDKADIFESINNLYNSNSNKHADLDYLGVNLDGIENNNNVNNNNDIKEIHDSTLNNNEEAHCKKSENNSFKDSPAKKPIDDSNKKNVVYSSKKPEASNIVYSNHDNFKRNKNNYANGNENKGPENNFPLQTDTNSNKSSRNNNAYSDNTLNKIRKADTGNTNFNSNQAKNFATGKIYSAKNQFSNANDNPEMGTNNSDQPESRYNYESGLKQKENKYKNINNDNDMNYNRNNLESLNSYNNKNTNLEKNNLNNNFISNSKKNTSFLPSESMLSKHINKQKNVNYNIADNSSSFAAVNPSCAPKGGYQRHFASKPFDALNAENDSDFEEIKNLENIVFIRAKLDSKKNELKELKKQYDEVCFINSEISQQLNELENYKANADEKIKALENNIEYNENKYMEREMEMMNSLKGLEESRNFLEEKYVKLCAEEKLREREMELLNQKIKDMEIILEENENEHINTIKNIKLENEEVKNKQHEYEKLVDIFSYFFRKLQTYYNNELNFKNINSSTLNKQENSDAKDKNNQVEKAFTGDCQSAQNKLIELEDFIIQIIKEKNIVSHQFTKLLEFQKKFNCSSTENLTDDYFNNPLLHLENIKNLNEKIFDLSEENSYLKQEIQKIRSSLNKNVYSSNSPTMGVNSTQMNTLEINNGSKERDYIKTSSDQSNPNFQSNQNYNLDSESLSFKNNYSNTLNRNKQTNEFNVNNSNSNQIQPRGIGNSYDSNNENQYYSDNHSIKNNNSNNNNYNNNNNTEEERNYNVNYNSNPNPVRNHKNNVEMVRTILEPLGAQENKKYNFEYYPSSNNNNNNKNLTLENTSINNYNPNKASFDNYLDNDRNASPCFSNMDKFTGMTNFGNTNNANTINNSNLHSTENRLSYGPEADYVNLHTKKDSGMSFRKTDSQNIFKNNYNNSNYNLNSNSNKNEINEYDYENSNWGFNINNKKKNLNLNINQIETETIENPNNKFEENYNSNPNSGENHNENVYYENNESLSNSKANVTNNSYVSNDDRSKNANPNKNSNKFSNLVSYKREKGSNANSKPNAAYNRKSSEKNRISKSPSYNKSENHIETNNSNNSYVSNENSQNTKNLNLKILEKRINELENQLKLKENLQNQQKSLVQKYQSNEENIFDCSQEVNFKNTENSNASNNHNEKAITPNKNNFKNNTKPEKSKNSKTSLKGTSSVSSKQSINKNSEKSNLNKQRKNSIINNDRENVLQNNYIKKNTNTNTIGAHSSENYNTITNNKFPRSNAPNVPREKSAPKIISNAKSVEKKVVYSNLNTQNSSGLRANSRIRK